MLYYYNYDTVYSKLIYFSLLLTLTFYIKSKLIRKARKKFNLVYNDGYVVFNSVFLTITIILYVAVYLCRNGV